MLASKLTVNFHWAILCISIGVTTHSVRDTTHGCFGCLGSLNRHHLQLILFRLVKLNEYSNEPSKFSIRKCYSINVYYHTNDKMNDAMKCFRIEIGEWKWSEHSKASKINWIVQWIYGVDFHFLRCFSWHSVYFESECFPFCFNDKFLLQFNWLSRWQIVFFSLFISI